MIRILKENYIDTIKVWNSGKNKNDVVEFFINPNRKEFKDVLNSYPNGVRGVILKNGDLLIWKGDIVHYNALDTFYNEIKNINIEDSYKVEISPEINIKPGAGTQTINIEKLKKRIDLCLKKNPYFKFSLEY